MTPLHLSTPCSRETIRSLKVGDRMTLSGTLFTARDAVFQYVHEGHPLPCSLDGMILFHCGPIVVVDAKTKKRTVMAAGPTSSTRMESTMECMLRDHGVVGMIGKGGMGKRALELLHDYGAVYLHAVGGSAALLARHIVSVDEAYCESLGESETMWSLSVDQFPAVVTMDAHGHSLHMDIERDSLKQLKALL